MIRELLFLSGESLAICYSAFYEAAKKGLTSWYLFDLEVEFIKDTILFLKLLTALIGLEAGRSGAGSFNYFLIYYCN